MERLIIGFFVHSKAQINQGEEALHRPANFLQKILLSHPRGAIGRASKRRLQALARAFALLIYFHRAW